MKQYSISIDHESCWGCRTCEVACKQENHAPDGVRLIAVREAGPFFKGSNPDFVFRVDVCRHCEDPPCAEACPVDAIEEREDGIVVLSVDECTGCESCVEACPHGAIAFDFGEGVARKCDLCFRRVEAGLVPACADNVCLGHCIRFETLESA